jgi:hypothetical protein
MALSISSWAEDNSTSQRQTVFLPAKIWKTRPVRRDPPLREENITDQEVLQIEGVMRELYPGAIVYLSAVTDGCPCEDGPGCEDQVWSVAERGGLSDELALSKIDGEWQVGPLQEWWLVRDRIWDTYEKSKQEPDAFKRIDFQEYLRRLDEHFQAFPTCKLELNAGDA